MKKFYLFTLTFIMFNFISGAQSWEKLFSAKNTDVFRSVKEVPAGGYIAVGYTSDSTVSDSDAYVVRMTELGDTLWTYRQNIGLSKKDLFYKVIVTADGGFAMCGYTSSITGVSDDILIVKLNSSGQLQWTKTRGGSGRDRAQDIIELSNGSFVVTGYTTSSPANYYDAFLYKINSSGDSLWYKLYSTGTFQYDDANSVRALSNGGFLMGGQSQTAANGLDQFLIRTDDSGNVLWTKEFGTPATDNIEYIAVGNNCFYLAGGTAGAGVGGDDGYVVKTDTLGNVIWAKTYGGSFPDDFHTIQITSDGGLIMAGTTSSTGPLQPNMWLMRTNSDGDSLWSHAYGGDNHDHGYSGIQTSDGGFVIVGHTGSFGFNGEDAYIVKTNSSGNVSNGLTYTTITSLISPTSVACGSANVQVKVLLRNFGNVTVPNVPSVAVISGPISTTLNTTYNGNFYAQDADTLVFTPSINTSVPGTYTFVLSTNNDNDVYPARNSLTVSVTIDGNTGVPSVTNGMSCGSGTVSLSATSAGTVYWFDVSSGGSPVATGSTFITPTLTGTTTYYAQTGLACPSSRASVTATINTVPAAPSVTDNSRCGTGTVNLSASSVSPSIEWYDVNTGGSPVGTGTTFTTPSISSTTIYYAQSVDASTCVSLRTAANAVINTVPADPVTTGGNVCGAGNTTVLEASGGGIFWYDDASGTNQVGTGGLWVTPAVTGTTTFYAQSFDGTCGSNFVPATATVVGIPTVDLGPDTAFEIGTVYIMDAGAGFSAYQWNTGEQTQIINAIVPDTFCVTVTDANGCTASDCALIDFFVGIPDHANSAFGIYPNPASDFVNIHFSSQVKNAIVSVVDLSGKTVYMSSQVNADNGTEISIDIAELNAGVYFLNITSADNRLYQKLIIQ